MADCYTCGRVLGRDDQRFRRQVQTGTTERVNYGRRVSFGTSTRSGLRTVCAGCAASMDAAARAGMIRSAVIVSVLAVGGIVFCANHASAPSERTEPAAATHSLETLPAATAISQSPAAGSPQVKTRSKTRKRGRRRGDQPLDPDVKVETAEPEPGTRREKEEAAPPGTVADPFAE
jgi:hypothetical protein